MVLVRNDLIVRRLIDLEPLELEGICIELTLSKKKWAIFSVYRFQIATVKTFFERLLKSIDFAINKYENIVVMGDININTHDNHCQGINDLKQFCDILGLANLIKSNTCDTKTSSSSIDVILTNKCKSFRFTRTIETGISDVHRLVTLHMRDCVPLEFSIEVRKT